MQGIQPEPCHLKLMSQLSAGLAGSGHHQGSELIPSQRPLQGAVSLVKDTLSPVLLPGQSCPDWSSASPWELGFEEGPRHSLPEGGPWLIQ